MLQRFGCLWIAIAIIGGTLLLAKLSPRVAAIEVTDAEYQACKTKEEADFLAGCFRESLADDMAKSRLELPRLPTKEERVRNCQANLEIAKSVWKLYPDPCRSRR